MAAPFDSESEEKTRSDAIERWIGERVAGAASLSSGELLRLTCELGAKTELWSDRVHHDPAARHDVRLHVRPELEIWLVCWLDGQTLGLRDRVASSGCVYVVEGSLAEHVVGVSRNRPGPHTYTRLANTAFCFGGDRVHSFGHTGDGPATSIHAYVPSLVSSRRRLSGTSGASRTAKRSGNPVVA